MLTCVDKQSTCVHSEQLSHSNARAVSLTTNLQTGQKDAFPRCCTLEQDDDEDESRLDDTAEKEVVVLLSSESNLDRALEVSPSTLEEACLAL